MAGRVVYSYWLCNLISHRSGPDCRRLGIGTICVSQTGCKYWTDGANLKSACAGELVDIVPEIAKPVLNCVGDPPLPLSMTHRHLLSCIKGWIAERHSNGETIRILDVGCGDGQLIRYLTEALAWSHGKLAIEIYGMDVYDHGVQASGYFDQTLKLLSHAAPAIEWKTRLQLVSVSDPWPYPDRFFDIVISNQVLEHVGNHNYFFSQHRRVMKDVGAGFHLFPLWHCVLEPHLRMPFVHWIRDREHRARAIKIASKLGFGKFNGTKDDLQKYASAHADYLTEQVNYKTQREIALAARETGLHPSFSKSHHYYLQKLRSLAGRPADESYGSGGALFGRALAFLLRYVSSSTLELRVPAEENEIRSGQR